MDVIIAAGGIPQPEDPMYPYTQGKPKALIDMNGRTSLERVVDALQDSKNVEDIVIVGLGDDMGQTFKRPVHHVPDQGSLVKNGIGGARFLMELKPEATHFLACTADIPLITGEMIDAFIEMCEPVDKGIYYIMVTKEALDARFPNSTRTYVKLKDLLIAGGDISIMSTELAKQDEILDMVANGRKHAWKLARIAGLKVLIKFIFRRLTLPEIEATAERVVGVPAKIVLNPPAELAMDADKPDQVELVRAELEKLS